MIILKSKIKVLLIMMMSAVVLIAGISVAYYNTYSMIYEEEPVIVSAEGGEYFEESSPVESVLYGQKPCSC